MHSRTSLTSFITLPGYYRNVIEQQVNFLIHYETDCGYKGHNIMPWREFHNSPIVLITHPPTSCRKEGRVGLETLIWGVLTLLLAMCCCSVYGGLSVPMYILKHVGHYDLYTGCVVTLNYSLDRHIEYVQ